MNVVPLDHVITLSAILFVIGVVGVLTRRNLIVMLMSIELMLNAVNLAFVAFNRMWPGIEGAPSLDGQVFVLMVIATAAAEVSVGLGILLIRCIEFNDVDERDGLKDPVPPLQKQPIVRLEEEDRRAWLSLAEPWHQFIGAGGLWLLQELKVEEHLLVFGRGEEDLRVASIGRVIRKRYHVSTPHPAVVYILVGEAAAKTDPLLPRLERKPGQPGQICAGELSRTSKLVVSPIGSEKP